MEKRQLILIIILLVITFVLRFYKIDKIPASLYYDEIDYGYQARSLIQTGKDYRGGLNPFYVHSANDIRTPIPAYLTVLTTILFNNEELQVRMPFVISGLLVVLLSFLILQLWTKKFWLSYAVGVVFATNPWQIQFSRFSHEVMIMMLVYLVGLWSFYKAIKNKRYLTLLFASVAFSLTLYTYRTMSFYAPLTLISLFVIYHKQILVHGIKKIVFLAAVCGVIIGSFLYATTLGAPDIPRINQISISSDTEAPIWVQRNREVDSGDYTDKSLGKRAVWFSYFFHNKPFSWLATFSNNYFTSFSMEFLFINGDPNLRHSIGKMGELFFVDILGLVFGLYYIGRNIKEKHFQWLIIWFVTSPIPAALTIDGSKHAARLFIFSAPLLIIVGIGWWFLINQIKKFKFIKFFYFAFASIWLSLFVFYLHKYYVHYPIESARYFGYGFKQIVSTISREEEKYKKVMMVQTSDPPMLYYLFWSKTPPEFLQEYGTNFSPKTKIDKKLDKYKVFDWSDILGPGKEFGKNMRADTLYLATKTEIPDLVDGVKLIDFVKYPDTQAAFYLLTRDPKFKAE